MNNTFIQNLEYIYNKTKKDLDLFCENVNNRLKKGIFIINLKCKEKIKKIKIYNKCRECLHLRGIELYNNGNLLDTHLLNYTYKIGKLYNDEYKNKTNFAINKILEPYIFHTVSDIKNNYIEIEFIEYIIIDKINIYTRNQTVHKRVIPLCVDIQYENMIIENYDISKDIINIDKLLTKHVSKDIDLKQYQFTYDQLYIIFYMIILAKLEYFNNFNDTFYMCNKLNIDAFAVKYFINNRILQDKNYQITLKY